MAVISQEMAALHNDHYTQIRLYCNIFLHILRGGSHEMLRIT